MPLHVWMHFASLLMYVMLTTISIIVVYLYWNGIKTTSTEEGRTIIRAIILRFGAFGAWMGFLGAVELAHVRDDIALDHCAIVQMNLVLVVAMLGATMYFLWASVKQNRPRA